MKPKTNKKQKSGHVLDGVYYATFTDYVRAMTPVHVATPPAPGAKRIVWQDGRYVIEEYCAGMWACNPQEGAGWEPVQFLDVPCFFLYPTYHNASARTLWGIRRIWKKLYGSTVPFPSLKLVYVEDGK